MKRLLLLGALLAALVVAAVLIAVFVLATPDAPEPTAFEDAAVAMAADARVAAFFDPDPPREKGNTVWLHVTRDGDPVEGAEIAVEAMMPKMGTMPEMRERADVTEIGDGIYRAGFDLPMGGGWTLEVDVGRVQANFQFTVGSAGLIGDGGGGTAAAAEAPLDLPEVALPDDAVLRLREAFAASDAVHDALAEDRVDGIPPLAGAMARSLEAARPLVAEGAPELGAWVEAARASAQGLEQAGTLDTARDRFAELQRTLFALASAEPRLRDGYFAFECGMRAGFSKWLQDSAELENPYMGQAMPDCGTPTSWATAGPRPGEHVEGAVRIDAGRRQEYGIRTALVAAGPLSLRIRAPGQVVFDESEVQEIALTTGGYVRELLVDETGQRVRQGQPLFTAYDPALYAAQKEWLLVRGRSATDPLRRATRERLRLLGLTEAQIDAISAAGEAREALPIVSPVDGYVIEKNLVEGQRFEAGEALYRVAPIDRVWVEAEVYAKDVPYVEPGQTAIVTFPTLPGEPVLGEVQLAQPTIGRGAQTRTIRVPIDNPDEAVLPGLYADVTIEVERGQAVLVPESAVLYAGDRRVAFVEAGDGRLVPREVEVGAKADGMYQVLSGLAPGDRVVVSGTFLVAAESRLRAATDLWEGGDAAE